jgi:hypothetical protein
MWLYCQKSGELIDGRKMDVLPEGVVATGYSGFGAGLNDPEM